MKALSLYQPWATLIAIEAKWIETRSWATQYRGPLAIHAGKTTAAVHAPIWDACVDRIERGERSVYPPGFVNGAVIATCRLEDCIPIVGERSCLRHVLALPAELWLADDGEYQSTGVPGADELVQSAGRIDDQRPYGDFSPGRFAWLLRGVELLSEPIPARGAQGLWEWAA